MHGFSDHLYIVVVLVTLLSLPDEDEEVLVLNELELELAAHGSLSTSLHVRASVRMRKSIHYHAPGRNRRAIRVWDDSMCSVKSAYVNWHVAVATGTGVITRNPALY